MARELLYSWTKKDFRIDWFSGTGAGGQYRNKHQNCCRITHIASGLVATGQEHRERPANQRAAFHRLAAKVVAFYLGKEKRARYSGTDTIRTYHEPDNRVKDGASGLQMPYSEIVGRKNITPMVDARRGALAKLAETEKT